MEARNSSGHESTGILQLKNDNLETVFQRIMCMIDIIFLFQNGGLAECSDQKKKKKKIALLTQGPEFGSPKTHDKVRHGGMHL